MSTTPQPETTKRVDANDGAFGEAAYCHHRHHLDEHSTDFDTCQHSICVAARAVSPPPDVERLTRENERLLEALRRAQRRLNGFTRGDGVGLAYEACDIVPAALSRLLEQEP